MQAQPIRILFVEDSEVDLELSLRALRRDGFEVEWVNVETEADFRAGLLSHSPDIILSDFSMPLFDGIRALNLARQIAPAVPFVYLSGTIGEERAIQAIRSGATDYVLKDNILRLGTAIRRALVEAAERRRVEVAEEERARLVEILEATSDDVAIATPEGELLYLNAAGRRLIALAPQGAPEAPLSQLQPPWARTEAEQEARSQAMQHGVWEGESAVTAADGEEIPVSQVVIAHRGSGGELRFFSTIARDIRQRKSYEERIEYLAHYDSLTGLPNRALLSDRTAQAIVHARRFGRLASVIVLNVDRFKLVNEGLGLSAGEALLKQLAERLKNAVRDGDTVARLQGDSFAVLAAGLARSDDLHLLCRKIQDAMRAPFPIDEREVHITVSLGSSVYPRDGEDFGLLLRNAEAAMSRVKTQGGNAFQFYASAMTREALERVELENELRLAMGRGELSLHFQPQIELGTRRIIGVEALMRWLHPALGSVSPAVFVPIAEDSELIQVLGEFALEAACRQIVLWDQAGISPLRVAVNVSARQFRSPRFVDLVASVLRDSGLAPGRLELELTEGVLVEKQEEAVDILTRLKALGVQIAVDDFGTGYSSLSYLSRLPIDCLKIDRSFVNRMLDHARDATIAQAVVSLAHALGLRVVAEGIETVEQLEFLLSHGCDEGQGYFVSRPLPAEAITGVLSEADSAPSPNRDSP
jgi:diguanylate cyclase (GGDEF)-like protein/PAS domain S-box-containing protein